MKELVLYYTPSPASHVAKLKSVLVRMGVRIKNISPEQVNQTVGYLAGLPGFEECANQAAEFCEAEKLGKAEKSGETERSGEAGTLDKAAKLPVIPDQAVGRSTCSAIPWRRILPMRSMCLMGLQ